MSGNKGSDYRPAPGDVVEFEYRYKTWKGICLNWLGDISITVDPDGLSGGECWAYLSEISNAKLIEHLSDIPTGSICGSEGKAIAKAYFTSAKEQVGFKVGDKVKVVRSPTKAECDWWDEDADEEIGGTFEVFEVDSDGDLKLRDFNGTACPYCIAELATFTADPALSYAENQKAWIDFHGLKVGSKVKVVRKFKDSEGGYGGGSWEFNSIKSGMQGEVCEVLSIQTRFINLKRGSTFQSFPYFSLEPVK